MDSLQTTSKVPNAQATLLFGELLVSKGLLSHDELQNALEKQREQGGRLGEVLLRLKILDEKELTAALAEHFSMEYIPFDENTKADKIDMEIARKLPESIARRFCLVAVAEEDNNVVVAMADPLNVVAVDTVTLKLKRTIKPAISSPTEIRRAIESIYHGSDVEEQQLRNLVEIEVGDETRQDDVTMEDIVEPESGGEDAANKAPVIRFVDLLMSQAVKCRASDIHIEPQEKSTVVRMRVDGVLRDMVPPARRMQAAVTARIKIVARMDIAERRLPQDGRFKMKISGKAIDVRVSTIPTIYGEKVVMRILDASAVKHDLDQLGLEPQYLAEFKDKLAEPHGIIIVTGPTGSGKSTTLYSALTHLKDPTKNITTVEDPVEYRLAGINQIQVKQEIDLDFARCLRAILRQDPDIVLIGTNDAPSAISRLLYMGIERYLLASALNLIIAQRLVRRICIHCREPVILNEEVIGRLGIDNERAKDSTFYRGRGCQACGGSGYLGRLPIFEFLVVDNDISKRIIASETESQIREAARKKDYGGLLESGVGKVLEGLTTAEEVIRTAFTDKG
ncbi:MAG: GspE/PulE family protein [Planctomycetota bacterium]|jgi:type IV pilus assembly protein PilB